MSQAKHTPGPYGAFRNSCFWEVRVPAEGCAEPGEYSPSIAFIWSKGRENEEEAQANAQLFAAAPELLEALKAVYAGPINEVKDGRVFLNISQRAFKIMEAAIAKAEGGAL